MQRFYELCRENHCTGCVMVTSYGIEITLKRDGWSAGYTCNEPELKSLTAMSVDEYIYMRGCQLLKTLGGKL